MWEPCFARLLLNRHRNHPIRRDQAWFICRAKVAGHRCRLQSEPLAWEAYRLAAAPILHLPTELSLVPYSHHVACLPKVLLYLVVAEAGSLKLQ